MARGAQARRLGLPRCQRGAGLALRGCPSLSQAAGLQRPLCPRARRDRKPLSPRDLLEDAAATAANARSNSQHRRGELPGSLEPLARSASASSRAGLCLSSPLLHPAPRCCCPCSQTWGRASRTAPVGTAEWSDPGTVTGPCTGSARAVPAAPQEHPKGPPLPQPPAPAASTPAGATSCSRTLPCAAQPGLPGQVLGARPASRQSLPGSWEALHDKAG